MDNQSDERLLIRIDEKVSNILRRMDGYDASIATIESRIDRVEARASERLSKLENWRWFVIGVSSVISFLMPIILGKFL